MFQPADLKTNGYFTTTIPPPFGFGNRKRRNLPVTQLSVTWLPSELESIEALDTVPSAAMVNLTRILPLRFGFLFSSFW